MKQSHDAPDIVSKIREALEQARKWWVVSRSDEDNGDDVNTYLDERIRLLIDAELLLPQLESLLAKEPVSLMDCAMALRGNEGIKLGSDLLEIARPVLEKAGVPYAE